MVLAAVFSLFALGSCTKNEGEDTPKGITLNQEAISINAAGGQRVVSITSNHTDFDVTYDADWITHTIVNKSFQLTIAPNGSKSMRETVIIVTALDGSSVTIPVKQLGLDAALVVDKTTIAAAQTGESVEVTIASNIEWRVVYEENWIEATANEAGDAVSIKILENELFEDRTAVIGIVPVSDEFADLKKEITVTQGARPYEIAVSGEALAGGNIQVLSVTEEPVVLNVVANSDWDVTGVPQWLTLSPQSGEATDEEGQEVTLEFTENGDTDDRSAEIVFACGNKTVKVNVVQKGAALFFDIVDAQMTKITNEEATQWDASSKSNGTLSIAVSDDSWLSAAVDGLNFTMSAAANTTGARREGTVTVTASLEGNDDIAKVYTIVQLPEAVDLSAEGTANCYIVNKAGTYKLNAKVQGNGAKTYKINPETLNPSDGILVWSSSDQNIIGDVVYKNDYLYFTTSGEDGNAVVAVREGDDLTGKYVAWSWHIWMTSADMNDPANQYEVSDLTQAVAATWMDRNLGAMSDGDLGTVEDIHKSFGMFYQFGRKDPLPGATKDRMLADWTMNLYGESPVNNTTVPESNWGQNQSVSVAGTAEKVYYYIDAYTDENGQTVVPNSSESYKVIQNTEVEDLDMTLVKNGVELSILNPHAFIGCGNASPYCWFFAGSRPAFDDATNGWGHLWGNNVNTKDLSSRGEKTIYDPCPVGWKVPSSSEFRFITSHGDDIGRNYLGNAPWKANCIEVYEAFQKGNVRQFVLGGASKGNYNTYLKLDHTPYGFHFFVEDRTAGTALPVEEPDTRPTWEGYTHIPDGDLMFLPAAGCITHGGLMARVGAACHYWTNQPSNVSADSKNPYPEGSYPLAGGIEANMVFQFFISRQVDYAQVGVGASVRCVKIQ